ncbi:MAG TPA: aminotransferase [Methylomirabilota bacterium]|jgi:taurine-pyruvate aminotransferase|nr:aminotransferase [Methylomirabilota bacterium]
MSNAPDRPTVVRQDLDNVIHPIVPHKQLEQQQLVIVSGKDSTVVDADGREYLDGMAGLWCVNIGYGRTELAEVAADQMRDLAYYPHTAMNRPAAALAEKVNGLLGGDNHVYFVSSGSEANEAAFKFARQYARHEFPQHNRYKTISRYYAYHGTTLATLAAGGMGDRKMKFEPLSGNDFVHVAPPYCYRCPFGLEPTSCELACVKNMETTIQGEGPETVAEVIIEPIMSAVGVAVPPDGYLPAVAELCKKHGVLLHVDEVINGFGRTGRLFAHEHAGIKPDIVTVAKGISSAYLPMAATVVRNTVFQSFLGDPSENRQVNQVNTYGGHPVAAAVALRNIEILLQEELAERSAENGKYLLDGLRTLTRHKWLGDVRGKGLYAGVELVTDRASKAVMPQAQIKRIVERCQELGVIVGRSGGGRHLGNTLVLAPPLVLTRPEIDRIVSVLDRVIPEICPEAAA